MVISGTVRDQQGFIDIHGRFDFFKHRAFRKCYAEMLGNSGVREIEINMRNTQYIDSSALGMLLLLHERALAAKKQITLSNPHGDVSALLMVANFDKLFHMQNIGACAILKRN